MDTDHPGFAAWIASVSPLERSDPLWRMSAYRLARFVGTTAWADADRIRTRPLGGAIADQLLRAVHSIAANVAEGYSRSSGRDRVRFLEYALGSARESVVWYEAARPLLGTSIDPRLELLVEIRKLLLTMIQGDRSRCVGTSASRARTRQQDS